MNAYRCIRALVLLPILVLVLACEPVPPGPGSAAVTPEVFADVAPAGTGVVRVDGNVLRDRERFFSGSRVETGPGASALISFSDGARVQFDENTDPAAVSWSGNTLRVQIDDGLAGVTTGSVLSISEIITSLAELFTRSEVIVEEDKRVFMRADLFSGTMQLTRPVSGPRQQAGQYALVRPNTVPPATFGRTSPAKARALRQRLNRWEFKTSPAGSQQSTPTRPTATIRMPNLLGRNVDEARRQLAEMGMAVSQIADVTQGQAQGAPVVIRQTPPSGSVIEPGTFISLTVQSRVVELSVPDVTGSQLGAAVRRLRSAGLTYSIDGPNEERTIVVGQFPRGREQVSAGTPVRLTTRQPDPPPTFVPDLGGRTVDQALAILQRSGLRLGQIIGPQTGARKVVAQAPRPNTRVPAGSAVTITVVPEIEQNPVVITPQIPGGLILQPNPWRILLVVPDVQRKSVMEALRILQSQGFSTELRGASGRDAVVVAQQPAGGTRAGSGSVVIVTGASPQQIQ